MRQPDQSEANNLCQPITIKYLPVTEVVSTVLCNLCLLLELAVILEAEHQGVVRGLESVLRDGLYHVLEEPIRD